MGLGKAELGILMVFATHHAEHPTRFDIWTVRGFREEVVGLDVYAHRFWTDTYGAVEVEHHMSKVLRRFPTTGAEPATALAIARAEARVHCDQAEAAYYQIRDRLAARAKKAEVTQ